MLLHHFRNGFGLSLSEQGRRACRPQPESFTADDLDPDGFGQAFCFIEPRLGRAQILAAAVIGQGKDGTLAARNPGFVVTIEDAQPASPSPSPPPRSSAWAGWRVDTACL
jgi:hypothetical protein